MKKKDEDPENTNIGSELNSALKITYNTFAMNKLWGNYSISLYHYFN